MRRIVRWNTAEEPLMAESKRKDGARSAPYRSASLSMRPHASAARSRFSAFWTSWRETLHAPTSAECTPRRVRHLAANQGAGLAINTRRGCDELRDVATVRCEDTDCGPPGDD